MNLKFIFERLNSTFFVALLFFLALGAWDISKYQIVPKRWGVVENDKIFRSGRIAPRLMRTTLEKHGIKVILDLTDSDRKNLSVQAEEKAVKELGITRYNFELIGDGTGNITNYARAIAVIVQARSENKPVLVHCAAGAQRTGGVIAAYRLLVEKQLPSTAYAELTRYGWKSRHDRVLLDYLNGHLNELAALLQEMKVITSSPSPALQIAH